MTDVQTEDTTTNTAADASATATVDTTGIAPLDTEGYSTSTMLKLYNDYAFEVGQPTVTKFADRDTAARRLEALHLEVHAARAARSGTTNGGDEVTTVAGIPTTVTGGVKAATKANAKAAIKKADAKAPDTPATGPTLPIPSDNPRKDAEMPAIRRATKALDLKPKAKVYPRRVGSKQALLVDLLSRSQGATFAEIWDACDATGKPWTAASIRSGMAWDINHTAGYGITSTLLNGEDFAKEGRKYEAARLGVGTSAYNPDFKLLVYYLTYPKGVTAPLPHTVPAAPAAPAAKAAAPAKVEAKAPAAAKTKATPKAKAAGSKAKAKA